MTCHTDTFCFTCWHEIKETLDGWEHIDPDDLENPCPCIEDGEKCQP